MKKYIATALLILAASCLSAQVDTFYIKMEYTPKLKTFKKINESPNMTDTVSEKVQFNYYITPQRYDATFTPTPIEYNKVSPDIQEVLYRNYIKVGFGYPVTPLLDFSFHNLQTDRKNPNSFGLNVHHFSSWAKPIGKFMKQYAYYPTSDTDIKLQCA